MPMKKFFFLDIWEDMWHRGPKLVTCRFWLFYSVIFYTASASKYILQNQNILFLTEVINTHLIRTVKKFKTFRVIMILRNHYFIILKLFQAIKFCILNQIRQTALKSSYNFTTYGKFMDTMIWCHHLIWRIANSKTPLVFGPLAQYLGSDKRWVLSRCVTCVFWISEKKCPINFCNIFKQMFSGYLKRYVFWISKKKYSLNVYKEMFFAYVKRMLTCVLLGWSWSLSYTDNGIILNRPAAGRAQRNRNKLTNISAYLLIMVFYASRGIHSP